ncbi:hypothetical protein LINPERPRIM_LOCUS8399 [Linum perenne]
MRTPNPLQHLPLFLLLLLILPLDFSRCTARNLRFTTQFKQSDDHQLYSSSSSPSHNFYFPTAQAPQGTREGDRVYGASYRAVPAGPNPLHN